VYVCRRDYGRQQRVGIGLGLGLGLVLGLVLGLGCLVLEVYKQMWFYSPKITSKLSVLLC
jgi:hypothetical protein